MAQYTASTQVFGGILTSTTSSQRNHGLPSSFSPGGRDRIAFGTAFCRSEPGPALGVAVEAHGLGRNGHAGCAMFFNRHQDQPHHAPHAPARALATHSAKLEL